MEEIPARTENVEQPSYAHDPLEHSCIAQHGIAMCALLDLDWVYADDLVIA